MKAIILRCIIHAESNLVIHAINANGEKVACYARGAKRSKKRFAGGILEPSHYVNMTVEESPLSDLLTLKEASLIDDFPHLRTDYDRLQIALKTLDLVSRIAKEGLESVELFHLTGNALKILSKISKTHNFYVHFQTRLLILQGFLEPIKGIENFVNLPITEHEKLVNYVLPQHIAKKIEVQIKHLLLSNII